MLYHIIISFRTFKNTCPCHIIDGEWICRLLPVHIVASGRDVVPHHHKLPLQLVATPMERTVLRCVTASVLSGFERAVTFQMLEATTCSITHLNESVKTHNALVVTRRIGAVLDKS